jgi:hypothetical protein
MSSGIMDIPSCVRLAKVVLRSLRHPMLVDQRFAWGLRAWLELDCRQRLCGFEKSTFGGMEKA